MSQDQSGVYVKKSDKRLYLKKQKATKKYEYVQQLVEETIKKRWNSGIPITKEELRSIVLKEAKKNRWEEWLCIYSPENSKNEKKFWVYLGRALTKIGFSVRKDCIAEDSGGMEKIGRGRGEKSS